MKTTRRAWKSIILSKKESLSYLLTLILSATLLFVFINMQNDPSFGSESISHQQRISNTLLLSSCTLIVAIICAINCYVANTYFVKAKSNELCVYLSCGMKITTLAKFLIIQNMILLGIALLFALPLGCLLNPSINLLMSALTGIQGTHFTIHGKGILIWCIILFFEMFFLILINIGYTYRTELKDLLDESRTTKLPDFRTIRLPAIIYPFLCILSGVACFFIPLSANNALICLTFAFFGRKGYLTRFLPYRQEKKRKKRQVLSSEQMVIQGNYNAFMKTSYMYNLMSFASLLVVLCVFVDKIYLRSIDIIVLLAYFLVIFMMGASIYFKLVLDAPKRKQVYMQLTLLGFPKDRIYACMNKEIIKYYHSLLWFPLPYALLLGIRFLSVGSMQISVYVCILGGYLSCFLIFMGISLYNLKTMYKQQVKEEKIHELCN